MMHVDPVIAAVADEFEDFTLDHGDLEEPSDPLAGHCAYARTFRRWVNDTLDKYVRRTPDAIRLAQAKMLLLDRYFEYRSYAPKGHRDKLGDKGHICLYTVLVDAYHEIRMAQLALDPPQVLIVPSREEARVPAAPLAQIPALFLGELSG